MSREFTSGEPQTLTELYQGFNQSLRALHTLLQSNQTAFSQQQSQLLSELSAICSLDAKIPPHLLELTLPLLFSSCKNYIKDIRSVQQDAQAFDDIDELLQLIERKFNIPTLTTHTETKRTPKDVRVFAAVALLAMILFCSYKVRELVSNASTDICYTSTATPSVTQEWLMEGIQPAITLINNERPPGLEPYRVIRAEESSLCRVTYVIVDTLDEVQERKGPNSSNVLAFYNMFSRTITVGGSSQEYIFRYQLDPRKWKSTNRFVGVSLHELGHNFGFGHLPESPIMTGDGNIIIDEDEIAWLFWSVPRS